MIDLLIAIYYYMTATFGIILTLGMWCGLPVLVWRILQRDWSKDEWE